MAVNIIFKNREAQRKESLVKEINDLMSISCDQLYVFFAAVDASNRPNFENVYNKNFGLEGFYQNRKVEGKLPTNYPREIDEEIQSRSLRMNQCEHFIWISKRICEAEDIHFAWVYSHELQHLRQSLKNPYLLIVANLLKYVKYEIAAIDIPTEFECEGKAKQIVVRIFGEEKCISYLNKMRAGSRSNEVRYSRLLQLNILPKYDVEGEIQQAICANIKTIKEIRKQRQNSASTNWNIDIDKLCTCKNPHDAIMSSVTRMSHNDDTH